MPFPTKRRHLLQSLGGFLAIVGLGQGNVQANPPAQAFYVATDGDDANPGTLERPWASLQKAAQTLKPGETVYVRGGLYRLTAAIQPQASGTAEAWITYQNYPTEVPIFDADAIAVGPWGTPKDENISAGPSRNELYEKRPYPPERGVFQVHDRSYLRIQGLTLQNAHSAGFEVRNSQYIDLFNNTTINTFSCGILVDAGIPVPEDQRSHHCRVIGNNVTGANNAELQIIHPDFTNHTHAPHEAISMGSVDYFEIAYNHVNYCYKELIDCKDSGRHGLVHHNYLHNNRSIGLYVDAWFAELHDLGIYENVIHNCKMGMVISVEGGTVARNITIRQNQIFDNLGTGIILGTWGKDGWRENIQIYNNTIYRNGYGDGDEEGNNTETPYWVTGGIYLHSQQVKNLTIANNIFNANQYFQIGHSQAYSDRDLAQQQIHIHHNLFYEPVEYPSQTPLKVWANDVAIALHGDTDLYGNPQFMGRDVVDLRLQPGSPARGQGTTDLPKAHADLGALPSGQAPNFWWAAHFPRQLDPASVSQVSW
ncbi:MAG: right-handed parallel beta-helix repeat-containing protein [Spirulinaceae cyanobacterium]